MTTSSTIGQKLWNYCNVLRDAGLSYGEYLEQLTYLIFLTGIASAGSMVAGAGDL